MKSYTDFTVYLIHVQILCHSYLAFYKGMTLIHPPVDIPEVLISNCRLTAHQL